jgi:tetratricopeptide (TPR) repeat protein
MALSLRDLVERRVPQYLAIYLGAGWGLIEFFSFLEGRFSLSPHWTNIVLFAWALMIPSVVLFTYLHGRPGKDRLTRPVIIGIPLNVVIVLFVLGSAFGGADLGATTTEVVVTDEAGNEVERRVANASYRKRLAIFDFDAAPADTSIHWLRQGAALALATDLAQDPFLDLRVQAHFREQLREAGVADGGSAQFTLRKKIAGEMHLPYFLSGSVASGVEGTTVRVQLYETASGRLVRERVSTSPNVLRAIDELGVQLKEDLGLPQSRPTGVQDLPVAELLSETPGAFRAMSEAQSAALRDDWDTAQREFGRAASLDSTFALANYALYQTRLMRGDAAGGVPALDAAMRHIHRLPERAQFMLKAEHYVMRQDVEKAAAVAAMMVELYPDDIQGHQMLAQFQVLRNDRDGAIASLRRILELDPEQHEVLLQIGALQEDKGAFEDAIATFEQYAAAFPSDIGAHLRVSRAHQRVGALDRAQQAADRALIADPTHVEATLERAILHRNSGEVERAQRLIADAAAIARTAEDRARVEAAWQSYYDFRGQSARAIEAMQKRLAAVSEFQPAMGQMSLRLSQLGTYVRAGRMSRAQEQLDEVRRTLTAPFDNHWRLGQLEIAIAARDTLLLPEAIAGVTRLMQQFNFTIFNGNVARGEAALAEARGDWQGALDSHQRFAALDPSNAVVHRDIARALRHLRRHDEALRAIDEHLRTVPFSPESNLEAARIRLADGDTAGARRHLDRAASMLADADASHASAAEVRTMLAQLGVH